MFYRCRALIVAGVILTCSAPAQWIPIRTVPLITADRASLIPSAAAAMGHLSLAYDDTVADPFGNPARSARLTHAALFLSPALSTWNSEGHTVRSLAASSEYPSVSLTTVPVGMVVRIGDLAVGGLAAHQAFRGNRKRAPVFVPFSSSLAYPQSPKHDIGSNTFLAAVAGMVFPDQDLTVGVSARWAHFGAVDGVWTLYPGNINLSQDGSSFELLAGAVQRLNEEDELEFLAGMNVLRSSHEAVYASFVGPVEDVVPWEPYTTERNEDKMTQWLMQAGYRHHSPKGWTFGAGLTVNWKDHPKIPNYRLMNIPRDPGTSIAYRAGVGIVWKGERTVFGLEYLYEPITSHTWAEAGESGGLMLPAAFHTVENTFSFSNHIAKTGYESRTGFSWLSIRLGAQFHFFQYTMDQIFPLSGSARTMDTDWLETTATGGLRVSLGNVDLLYTLQIVFGTGLVGTTGVSTTPWFPVRDVTIGVAADRAASNFLIAPSGDVQVDTVPVLAHQVSIVYRLH